MGRKRRRGRSKRVREEGEKNEKKDDREEKEGEKNEDDPGCEAHGLSNLFEEVNTLSIVGVRLLCP